MGSGVVVLYEWVAFGHVFSVFLFLLAHGVSTFAIFKIRFEKGAERIAAILDLSRITIGAMHMGLFLVLGTGIWLVFLGRWQGMYWPWVSLGFLIVLWAAMRLIGSNYYDRLRGGLGAPVFYVKKKAPPPPRMSHEELARIIKSNRPFVLTGVGIAGLGVILWLMMFKPF